MILSATGHRPNKLLGYGPEARIRLRGYATLVLNSYNVGYRVAGNPVEHVVGGMALGWDTAWVEAAIDLGIPFIAAVPFVGQEGRWSAEDQAAYNNLLKQAKEVVVVSSGGYQASSLQARNEWMTDNSHKIVALWDGSPGGTANCVRYANRTNRPVLNCWPHFDHWRAQ